MKSKIPKNQKGFIALISAIMLSLILLGLTLRVSSGNFSARANSLHAEFKAQSSALARSCSQSALLTLSHEYWYIPEIGGDEITVAEETCTIQTITHEAENGVTHKKNVTIITTASYKGAYTTLQTDVLMTNPAFTSVTSPAVALIRTREIIP